MKPNVLFITIDSFRSDKFLGSTKTSKTPNIDWLIKNGTYFSQAISSSDATLFSWASIFTSLYPFKTGIRSVRFNKIKQNVITQFDIFKNYNYNFYSYLPSSAKPIGLFPKFENADYIYNFEQKLDDGLGKKIIDKLKSQNLKEPWLFCIHILDLHYPLIVSKGFNDNKFGTNNYEKQISAIDSWIGKILEIINLEKTLLVISADHGCYIHKVNTNDEEISFETNGNDQRTTLRLARKIPEFLHPIKDRLFLFLEKKRQQKRLQIINNLNLRPHEERALLAANRFNIEHTLYDEQIRIPLLFVGPNVEKNKIITNQVRTVDIFPTISSLIEIPVREESIDGKNLKPLMEGKEMEEFPICLESFPLILVKSNDVIGIRTSKFKYFRDKNDSKKRVHLFDLTNDPFEDENIAEKNEAVVNEMETHLTKITKNIITDDKIETNENNTKQIENELKKLGYM